ncbi:MAG: RDD family protein [Ferrovum sp.]|nr:RDD family protein [Ferrovum sp.]
MRCTPSYGSGIVSIYLAWWVSTFPGFGTVQDKPFPMRTWHLQLLDSGGHPPSWGRAFLRYVLAIPGYLTGISLLWVLVDKEGQFLHDRLLGLTMRRY